MTKVEKLLARGTPTYVIAHQLARGKRPLSRRTVERYIALVHKRWKSEMLLRSETVREERLVQLQATRDRFAKLVADSKYYALPTVARYDEMINEILGVYAPQQVKVEHAGAVAVLQVPPEFLEDLPDEVLDLLEKKAAQLALPALAAKPVPTEGT